MQIIETWAGIVSLMIMSGAIVGGALTAFVRLTDRNTPVDTGLLHGRMGIAGVLLIVVLMLIGEPVSASVKLAIGLFALTIMAGITLYFFIRRKGILPKKIIFLHGFLAVFAMVALVFGLPV